MYRYISLDTLYSYGVKTRRRLGERIQQKYNIYLKKNVFTVNHSVLKISFRYLKG